MDYCLVDLTPSLVAFVAVCDLIIAGAYYVIPAQMVGIARATSRDAPPWPKRRSWFGLKVAGWNLALFIVACGTHHLVRGVIAGASLAIAFDLAALGAWMMPLAWLYAAVAAITALVSATSAVLNYRHKAELVLIARGIRNGVRRLWSEVSGGES